MRLLEMRGGYLHQHRPDIVPQGFITDEELALWCAYFEMREAEKPRQRTAAARGA